MMTGSWLIAGGLMACVVAAAYTLAALIERRTGRRRVTGGVAGAATLFGLAMTFMWVSRRYIDPDSVYWWIAIAASISSAQLISQALFGSRVKGN
jgi:hypothetical protein